MVVECPVCGSESLEQRKGSFEFDPPANVPGGVISIVDATWEHCTDCNELILPHSLRSRLQDEVYRRHGLLLPDQIRGCRERAGLSQEEMAQFVGVGKKTFARWEAGRSTHNKSSDNLIRLADRHPGLFVQLEAQRNPDREGQIIEYFNDLRESKGAPDFAVAAHGMDLEPGIGELLRERIVKIIESREKGNIDSA